MSPYCLKCKKNTKNIDARMIKMIDLCYHQNVLYVAAKNQNL